MGNNLFCKSEILHLKICTLKQRIQKLEAEKAQQNLLKSEEKELAELSAKLEVLTRRLAEIHQLILDFSVRIKSDNERYIVVEYFVNHTSRAEIASSYFYDRSGVYKIVRKYREVEIDGVCGDFDE